MFAEENVIYRYKYLPFSEGALKTLTEGTMKFTCPLDFNDPFDCLPHYDTSNIQNIPNMRPDLFKAAGNRKGLSPAQRLQQKGPFVARLKNEINSGNFAKDLISNVGVVSLSKNALSIPMWSHYADFHQGLVLEFRTPIFGTEDDASLSTDRLLPFPILYSADRPLIEIGTPHRHDLINKILLTKSLDWKYEEEERVIDHIRGPGIYRYRKEEILCSVIAGMKMSEPNFHKLTSLIETISKASIPNLTLYKARAVDREYKLEVKNHPRLSL